LRRLLESLLALARRLGYLGYAGVGVALIFAAAGFAVQRPSFQVFQVKTASALEADYSADPRQPLAPLDPSIIEAATTDARVAASAAPAVASAGRGTVSPKPYPPTTPAATAGPATPPLGFTPVSTQVPVMTRLAGGTPVPTRAPAESTPTPVINAPSDTPTPVITLPPLPIPTLTAILPPILPTATPVPASEPISTATPVPSSTPVPTRTPVPAQTIRPTATPTPNLICTLLPLICP